MSNSFRVVYEDFTDFGDELERNHSYWEERLAALESLFQNFMPESFQGETADSINTYFREIHGQIIRSFRMMMEISKRNFLMYKNDYYELIDRYDCAVISQDELEDIAYSMKRYKLELEDYHEELKEIVDSVSDIVSIKVPTADYLYDDYDAVIEYVETLRDDILELEERHKREDFVEFNEIKDRLTSFMEELNSRSRSYMQEYRLNGMKELASYAGLNAAIDSGERYLESTRERYEKAAEAENIRIAEAALKEGEDVYLPYTAEIAAAGEAVEINGELFVKLSDAAGYTNTGINTTKGIAAYIKDGFYVVKRGEYIYIKGARSASALAEGIKGTRYAVKNVDKYVSVGKYVDPKIAGREAFNVKSLGGKLGAAAIGLDVAAGVYENYQEGAEAQEYVVDAIVDGGFAAGGIWASAAVGAVVGSAIPIPIVGTLIGAGVGVLVGFAIDEGVDKIKIWDKTPKELAREGINKAIDEVQDAYSEENTAKRAESSHKR